jgi:hypothetical protein
LKGDEVFVLQGTGHLGFADLRYVGGYYSYEYDLIEDYDNTDRSSYVYTPPFDSQFGFQPPPVTIQSQQYFSYKEMGAALLGDTIHATSRC